MNNKQFLKKAYAAAMVAVMVCSSSALFAQVKIGSNPTSINAANNLEVEASTAGRKTSVDKVTGQVTIKDGTEGTGKILTSDATGGASWQAATNHTIWIGQMTTTYPLTYFDGTFNSLKDRIPLIPRSGAAPGWDPVNKQYIIQEDGYYRIFIGATSQGTLPSGTATSLSLYLFPFYALNLFENFDLSDTPRLSLSWEGFLTAGSPVDVFLVSAGVPQNAYVFNAFMSIDKLF
ncbi:hypothetical protein [Dyadobacter frigoris]|uniref:Uncharacterized protein n=1 Tax=Dyadobacter frigoris TaxID=2576211 RepID=A0A4U6D1C1_9BACT|nr:hypothetical protein [Dyadobacter frigoris]TKT91020.1 hypothetical protein FDK13_18885 [Dyadobacter frigoris]GLU56215.1 hypothetical protein Dfri01_56760 [Dyadobacter frigoris]